MRRRTTFPLVLLGATALWSVFATLAGSPEKSYYYLNDLIVEDNYAVGIVWHDKDIPHAEKLSEADKTLFMRMIADFDDPGTSRFERQIFLGQAADKAAQETCPPSAKSCSYTAYFNQTISPTLIHGDLRLISLEARTLRQDVTLYPADNRVEYGPRYTEYRKMRFMLTERGWVLKTAETTEIRLIEQQPALPLQTPKMSGLNYYPASASWDDFWDEFPQKHIAEDLDIIQDLGANAIRIFVQHDYFANPETQADGLSKLNTLLEICDERDIKVIVTLFDLRADYRFQNWGRDSVHLMTVLKAIRGHPALLAVDLKNQADLDFDSAGKANVLAWADAMITSARYTYPDIPLTIGWSDARQAGLLSEQLNLISFHDYHDPQGLAERLKQVHHIAGDKPVFVTEIGHSRWALIRDKSKRQANRLEAQLTQLGSADGVFVWTLHDFDEIGSNIVGHRPWRKSQQKAYGIVTQDGERRPAAEKFKKFNSEFISIQTGD